MANQIEHIKSKLREYKKKYYTKELLNGIILFTSILICAFLVTVLLEYYGNFSSSTRTLLFFSFVAVAAYALIKHIALPVAKLLNNDRELSDQKASQLIGEYFPNIKDKLLNTIQLSSISESQNTLVLASIGQKSEELNPYNFSQAIDFEQSKRLILWYLSGPFVILLGLFLFNKASITQSTDRIVNFNNEYVPKAPFNFTLLNQERTVFEGEDYRVLLAVDGESLPDEVRILTADGNNILMTETSAGQYEHTFYQMQSGMTFKFNGSGFNSPSYDLELLERPSLADLSLSFTYPRYLQKRAESRSNISNVSVPEGTSIQWNIQSEATDNIQFVFNDTLRTQAQRETQSKYVFKKQFLNSTKYQIELQNKFGKNKEPIAYQIDIVKDKYPDIQLERYTDTTMYSYILVGGNILDDYGLRALYLHYRITHNDGETITSNEQKIHIPIQSGKNSQNFVYQLNLDSLSIKAGETLDYYLTVWDNDGINGSKFTKSKLSSFKIPTKKDLKQKLNDQSESNKAALSKALSESEKLNQELKKLSDQLKTKKELDWQDKKDIEKVLQKQRELQSDLQKFQENVATTNEQKNRFEEEKNEELEEKMKQLQELMKNLVDEETKKMMDELQKLLEDKAQMEDINKKLQEINNKEESLEKQLDRNIEMYKQLELEEKMEQTIDELNQLSDKQEKLNEETEKAKNKEELNQLKKEQDKLNKEFDDIKKDLEEQQKLNQELENKKDLDEMKEDSKDVSENMENSSDSMEKGKKSNASQSQKNAAQKMKKMAAKMKESMQEQEAIQMEENIEDLQQILHNLIHLSFEQETVMQELKGLNQKDPLFVEYSQKQVYLERDSKIIEDSLYALAKRVFQLESVITKELSHLKQHMSESTDYIKQRNPRKAQVKQQLAMTSMNNLALLLDDVLSNMQEQLAKQKPGDQMCNKPGGGKPSKTGKGKPGGKPSMGDMQKQINDMIQELKNGQKSGKSMSSELAKLAAKQEMMRRQLQELKKGGGEKAGENEGQNGDNEGGTKGGQKMSENIKALEEAMKKTEEDLLSKNLTNQTIERQQEILTRLLEAENASKEREYDNKREANQADQKLKSIPVDYQKYIDLKQKQIELLRTVPPNLNPYYKKEVNEYFDKIEY